MAEKHGGDWAGYLQQYGREPLDFSANVSPFGLPEGVRQAVIDALSGAERYPDPQCRALRAALAAHLSLPEAYILCGNGAADLIWRLAGALRPERALLTAPTFGEYAAALRSVGCEIRHYTLNPSDLRVREDILTEITEGTDILFLCEPNNPTGLTTDHALLQRILDRCRACGCLLVVDECFNDFLDDPDAHTMAGELAGGGLMILRAFTKFYGMAGLRLGYGLCANRDLLDRMAAAGQSWAVSIPAQAAGIAALREKDYAASLRALIPRERRRLSQGLVQLGFKVIPGEANYLLFYSDDHNLAAKLKARGVLLRDCASYEGLGPGWYRAAVKGEADNGRFLEILREVVDHG